VIIYITKNHIIPHLLDVFDSFKPKEKAARPNDQRLYIDLKYRRSTNEWHF